MNYKVVSHAQRGNVSATVIICVALLVAYAAMTHRLGVIG